MRKFIREVGFMGLGVAAWLEAAKLVTELLDSWHDISGFTDWGISVVGLIIVFELGWVAFLEGVRWDRLRRLIDQQVLVWSGSSPRRKQAPAPQGVNPHDAKEFLTACKDDSILRWIDKLGLGCLVFAVGSSCLASEEIIDWARKAQDIAAGNADEERNLVPFEVACGAICGYFVCAAIYWYRVQRWMGVSTHQKSAFIAFVKENWSWDIGWKKFGYPAIPFIFCAIPPFALLCFVRLASANGCCSFLLWLELSAVLLGWYLWVYWYGAPRDDPDAQ